MANKSDGQLSFDLNTQISASTDSEEASKSAILSLCVHRERRDETERAKHFSEIIKLANHLARKV